MKAALCIVLLALINFSCQKADNTVNIIATLTTAPATSITSAMATSGGNITDDGGAPVTARGVCWGTSSNPDITGSHTTDGTGNGAFASSITGLTATTTYYVRAYATNSEGTAYGNQVSFTTTNNPAALPTVTTTVLSSITTTTAAGGGNVTADGGATITARGVCWSTTANPTTALTTKTTDGTGVGIFTSALTGLTAGTTYHVRAYATNSVGTAYGADETFTTTASIPADVYIAGYESISSITTVAKYWKNGVAVVLPCNDSTAYANDIFVSGTDVYVVGSTFFTNGLNFQWSVVLWKNGVPTIIAQTVLGQAGGSLNAKSVFVSGNDVYITGHSTNSNGSGGIVKLWKNGIATNLTTGATLAHGNSVFVSGTDVYVAGVEFIVGGSGIAKYWKNGVATSLSANTNNGEAESIFVSGSDVYVAGTESNGGSYSFAKLWKNGVATTLTAGAGSGYAHDLCVSGTDVYIAGQDYISTGSNSSVAKSWKNGVVTILPSLTPGYGTSIAVKGTDVYIVGNEFNGTRHLPKLWKNNIATTLSNTNGAITTGIFVQ
jgi:hypothetical protein